MGERPSVTIIFFTEGNTGRDTKSYRKKGLMSGSKGRDHSTENFFGKLKSQPLAHEGGGKKKKVNSISNAKSWKGSYRKAEGEENIASLVEELRF